MIKYKDKLRTKITEHCISTYDLIDKEQMKLGNLLYNSKCHLNSVQQIKRNQASEIYLCICTEKDNTYLVVHFINKDNEGFYIDNTLGWRYEQLNYYIIRKVNKYEYDTIWDVLTKAKKMLVNLYTSSFTRFVFNIKYDEFI